MAPVTIPTPHMRMVALLNKAAPLIGSDHPAYNIIQEVLRTAIGLDPYIDACSTPLIVPATHSVPEKTVREVFAKLLDDTDKEDWNKLFKEKKTTWELTNGMCSGDFEARVLQTIALNAGSTSVLEIGLFTGTATLALALLPKITRLVALDIEPFLETYDRPYWKAAGVSDKIETIFAPAAETLNNLKGQQFDLIFIDADKPSYETYARLALDLDILSPNGIILADNTLYKGYTFSDVDMGANALTPTAQLQSNNRSHSEATDGIKSFNNFVRNDPRLNVVVLPVRDGVSIITRKI